MGKYEEALERAKKAVKEGMVSQSFVDEIFGVQESEDERIRTRLIALVEAFGQGKYKDEMLAYLERQKDERELGFIEGKVEGVRQTCQEIKDAMSLFEPKDLTPFEFTFRDYIDSAIRYCLSGEGYQQYIKEWAADLLNLERQNEQKSEWSDTDMKEARNNLISVCRDWEFGKKTTLLPVVAVRARYFLEHLTEPKPAEWSEEDEGMLNCIIATLCEESHGGREANGKMVTWLETRLKSLRPQLIQDKFDSAMHVADKFEEGYKAGVYDTKAKSWKPSQQQMANLINVRDHVAQASGYWGESLSSLIDDLKKL